MGKNEPTPKSAQNRETQVAQDIFARDRGAQRDIPLNEFLTSIKSETDAKVQDERRKP